jgi:predicted phosphohydrolase
MPTLSIMSDLHLELALAPRLKGGDILLLAGDIWTAAHIENRGAARRRFEAFCKQELAKYGLIFLVHGNHEYYGSTLEEAPRIIQAFLEEHAPHAVVLDNESYCAGRVCFIGSTLWAPHGAGDQEAEARIGTHLADFEAIRFGGRLPFTPKTANALHQKAAAFLKQELAKQKKAGRAVIVITHHSPSFQSNAGRHYTLDLDAAFYSDQEPLITANPQIVLWVHGHSHASCRYRIGSTIIVSNQRGYLGLELDAACFDASAADCVLTFRGLREGGTG